MHRTTMMNVTENDISFAHQLADAAGAAIRPFFRKKIVVTDKGKAAFDPVTEADRGAERAIRALLKAERPADGILGEEYGEQTGTSGRTWVIDPVDGTRAFITGQTQWGTLIALCEEDRPVLGLFDQPVTGERFLGMDGRSMLIEGGKKTTLTTRPCARLSEAVVMTTHPWEYFTPEEALAFRKVAAGARMSRFGGDCYAYGLLGMGFIDLVIESNLKPWDIDALIPIVEGAGGLVTDWQGNPCAQGGRVIAAGDRAVHAEVLKILAQTA